MNAAKTARSQAITPRTEQELVQWYLNLYQQRTPAKSVLDCGGQRVTQTEVRRKMADLGGPTNVVDATREWWELYERRQLRRKVNAMRRAAGEGAAPLK
jgi:hypothetical protein